MIVSRDALEQHITSRTKLIIPVHFAGAAADIGPIRKSADDRGIFLVEDAAHALWTQYMGEQVGVKGTSIFSFHPIKKITTGEGVMFCSSDQALLDRIRQLKFHGLGVDAYDRQTQARSAQAEVLEPGYKYNITDISAALGISQLARVEQFNARRAELAAGHAERLEEVDEILPLRVPAYPMKHAWYLYIVRLDTEKARLGRNDFMRELKQRNIGTGLHFRAIHLQKYYREAMAMQRGMLPNTEWNSDRMCSVPLFPDMTLEDVDDVVNAIKECLSQ